MSSPKSIRHGPLRLTLPDGWFDASQVVAVGPEEDGFRSNLVVSLEPTAPGEDVQAFAARMLEGARAAPGFTLVDERSATFGANTGVLREYTLTVQGHRLAQLQFHILKHAVGFTFTYTQRAGRLSATRAEAERFFATAQVDAPVELALRPMTFRA